MLDNQTHHSIPDFSKISREGMSTNATMGLFSTTRMTGICGGGGGGWLEISRLVSVCFCERDLLIFLQ
jgi:hypothetical protein